MSKLLIFSSRFTVSMLQVLKYFGCNDDSLFCYAFGETNYKLYCRWIFIQTYPSENQYCQLDNDLCRKSSKILETLQQDGLKRQ